MERWQDKVAVVTGASSGIGAATSKLLVINGLKVVGIARRVELIEKLAESLPKKFKSNLTALKCDISKEEEIKKTFAYIQENIGDIHILVNNAGTTRMTELVDPNNSEKLKEVIDVNMMGILWCTREVFNQMKVRNIQGHIVMINSIAGQQVLNFVGMLPSFNIYPATKFALTSIIETLRMEFMEHKSKIKITSICPGAVDTNIFPDEIKYFVKDMKLLRPEDIADAVVFALRSPPHVQILKVTVKPMGEMF